jgi:hypothetical protein
MAMITSGITSKSSNRTYHPPVSELIQQAREGVLRRRVDEVASLAGLTDKEMAHVLGMSVRGLHGKRVNELLTLAASERLLLLEQLTVFDGRTDLLSRWLHTPLQELGYYETPTEFQQPVPVRDMGSFQEPKPMYEQTSTPVATETTTSIIPQSPLAVLDTVSGFSLADDVLGRIEWGIVG